jgi:hypothetical protein
MDNTLNLVTGKTILKTVKYESTNNHKNHCRLTQSNSKCMMTTPDLQWFQLKASSAPYQEQATVKNSNIVRILIIVPKMSEQIPSFYPMKIKCLHENLLLQQIDRRMTTKIIIIIFILGQKT